MNQNEEVFLYRIWPDGTVQSAEDGDPYEWMSDDYMILWAINEEDARHQYNMIGK